MKNFLRKNWLQVSGVAALGLFLLYAPIAAWAASASGTTPADGTATNMITGAMRINSITLVNNAPGVTATPYTIFDAPGTDTTFTNDVYVTRESAVQDVVRTYTDFFGATINITNTQKVITLTTNAASTNLYRILASGALSPGATQTIVPLTPLFAGQGFMIVGPTSTVVTIDHTKLVP